jgi:hypothetical protein
VGDPQAAEVVDHFTSVTVTLVVTKMDDGEHELVVVELVVPVVWATVGRRLQLSRMSTRPRENMVGAINGNL